METSERMHKEAISYDKYEQGGGCWLHDYADEVEVKEKRIVQLEGLWIEYLKQANLYSEVFGVEIPEELSGRLDMGLPLARKICGILGCDDARSSA